MDTIKKLTDYSLLNGSHIKFMGVPKTIDNDLDVTDHTPGYGSAAKYIGSITKEVIRDGLVYDRQSVSILEIMGRNAGWLTGAAALAKCCLLYTSPAVPVRLLPGSVQSLLFFPGPEPSALPSVHTHWQQTLYF